MRPRPVPTRCAGELLRRERQPCVWPAFVARCVDRLDGTGVRIATVVNFPTGDEPLDRATSVAAAALAAGADGSTSSCPTGSGSPAMPKSRRTC